MKRATTPKQHLGTGLVVVVTITCGCRGRQTFGGTTGGGKEEQEEEKVGWGGRRGNDEAGDFDGWCRAATRSLVF